MPVLLPDVRLLPDLLSVSKWHVPAMDLQGVRVGVVMRNILLLLTLALTGCATVDKAQLFDGATTWYALSQGYTEGNPFLADMPGPGILAVKLTVTQVVKLTPDAFCIPATQSLTVTGFAAGVWNLAVMASAWWAAIPVAVIVTWTYWDYWWGEAWLTCQLPLLGELNDFISDEPAMVDRRIGDQ